MKHVGMHFTFLLPSVGTPRHEKRIRALRRAKVDTTVYAFDRPDYDIGSDIEYRKLGEIEHGQYHRRIVQIASVAVSLRDKIQGTDVIYAFGVDLLLLAWLIALGRSKRPRIVCEVGDIRGIFLDGGVKGQVLRGVERFLLRRTDLLVVTSEAYLSDYYEERQKVEGAMSMVIENKVDSHLAPPMKSGVSKGRAGSGGALCIGYFGILRCHLSWQLLQKLGGEDKSQFQIVMRGIPRRISHLEEQMTAATGVMYGGPYANPADLASLYAGVDLSWVAFKHAEPNTAWARSNRFYEACYYNTPMIGQKGTIDGGLIEKLEIGLTVDMEDEEKALNAIRNISEADLAHWKSKLAELPRRIYTYTDEHERLIALLEKETGTVL